MWITGRVLCMCVYTKRVAMSSELSSRLLEYLNWQALNFRDDAVLTAFGTWRLFIVGPGVCVCVSAAGITCIFTCRIRLLPLHSVSLILKAFLGLIHK